MTASSLKPSPPCRERGQLSLRSGCACCASNPHNGASHARRGAFSQTSVTPMKHLLIALFLHGVIASSAFAQIKTLPQVLIQVCGPELDASSKCQRGDAGLAVLRGSQAKLVGALAKLDAGATVADIQRIVGTAPVQDSVSGRALLDNKVIERRIAIWNLTWESALGQTTPEDRVLMAVLANGNLMNLQLGGTALPRAALYYAAMECEPTCAGRLRMVEASK